MKFLDRFRNKKYSEDKKTLAKPAPQAVGVAVPAPTALAVKTGTVASLPQKTGAAYRFLMRPLTTEKTTLSASLGQYAFVVSPGANKNAIKVAVQQVYGVKVKSVNVMNYNGKRVSYGRQAGQRRDWRKAIVTLAKGQHIELYSKV